MTRARKLTAISSLGACGIPLRTLREWCERGQVYAEKVKGEWHIDMEAMLRRNGLDVLADELVTKTHN